MHGYFKVGNILCCIVSNTSLFMCKIHVVVTSLAHPTHIWASNIALISGHGVQNDDKICFNLCGTNTFFTTQLHP